MMRFVTTLVASWGIILVSMAGAGAQPQAGVARNAASIEEVVVTARRREESVQKVPIPVSAMSGQDMKDRAAEDLRDLTRVTPNLSFRQSGSSKNAAQIFLRGIGQVNWAPTQDPKIGTYQNGVYLGRPQGGVFDFLDIDRVEVLRGPQGTLFGRNTTAGLIHIISNRPTDQFETAVTGGVGKSGTRRGELLVNGPLTSTLAARFAFQHRQSDGYVKNVGTGQNWNDENAQNGRLSLRWTPTDNFMADMIVDYQRVREKPGLGQCEWTEPDAGPSAGAFIPGMAFAFNIYNQVRTTCDATRPYRSNENDPARSTVDAWSFTLDLNADLGWADLTSITAYRSVQDFNGSWGWGSDSVTSPSYFEVLGLRDNKSWQVSQEFRLAGTAQGGRLNWVAGAYVFNENAINYLDVPIFRGVPAPDCAVWPVFCSPSPVPPFSTLGQFAQLGVQIGGSRQQTVDATNASQAVFGEATWRFRDDWSITAGARFSLDQRDFTRSHRLSIGTPDPTLVCPDGSAPANGVTCKVQKNFNQLTPRVILSWNVSADAMLYFGWSKGYSSGGFNQDVRMRPFKPEISSNWEGGLKSTWFNNRFLFNVTSFLNNYKNQQITVSRLVNGNPTADLINAQQATLYGVEGQFRAELPASFYAQGSFGWLGGKYDKFTIQDNTLVNFVETIVTRDLSNTKMVRGAPYTYSVAVGKGYTSDRLGTVNGQIGWAFRGRSYSTLESLPSSRQGKYGLMDATLVWMVPDGRTTVSLWGSNLLDRRYFATAIDLSSGPSRNGTITKYWAEPRRYGLEVTYRLGG